MHGDRDVLQRKQEKGKNTHCIVHAGHLLHCWPGIFYAPAAVRMLASPALHAALSVVTLIGPGRAILLDGGDALLRGRPDMNSLVALGAISALGVSAVAAAVPALGWNTFFEEPAMLLSVVLLGRTLEERAKLQVLIFVSNDLLICLLIYAFVTNI
jgi:P-type Cu+ transporter